jgi:hypothetical protein
MKLRFSVVICRLELDFRLAFLTMEPNRLQETSAVLPVSVAAMFVSELLLDVSFKRVDKHNCYELAKVPHYNKTNKKLNSVA